MLDAAIIEGDYKEAAGAPLGGAPSVRKGKSYD